MRCACLRKYPGSGCPCVPSSLAQSQHAECPRSGALVTAPTSRSGDSCVGDHDLFIGEVLLEHVDADKVKANGERDESKLDPIVWLGRGFYKLGEKIGEYEGVKGMRSGNK